MIQVVLFVWRRKEGGRQMFAGFFPTGINLSSKIVLALCFLILLDISLYNMSWWQRYSRISVAGVPQPGDKAFLPLGKGPCPQSKS